MKTIFLVEQSEVDRARQMEQKLLTLPKDSGILFVGVKVIQDPLASEREVLYKVVIGCSRDRDPEMMDTLVKLILRAEVQQESQLIVEAHRGLGRP